MISMLQYFFAKIVTHYKRRLQNVVAMPLTPETFFDMYLKLYTISLPQKEGVMSYMDLKKSCFISQKHDVVRICFSLIKINNTFTT